MTTLPPFGGGEGASLPRAPSATLGIMLAEGAAVAKAPSKRSFGVPIAIAGAAVSVATLVVLLLTLIPGTGGEKTSTDSLEAPLAERPGDADNAVEAALAP